jgi:CTP:molybdopterin cytidylyltransferase MocA
MPSPEPSVRVIVLAAQRDGKLDPLAEEAGVSHKCLVPIGGRPLLAHVLDALSRVERVAEVTIVVEAGAEARLKQVAVASGMMAGFAEAADNIADSVYAGAEGASGPVVITTADNVLLTPAAVDQVIDRLAAGDDTVLALTRKEDVLSAHPEGQRRFYRFRDGAYSNCNLYGLSQAGLRLAETFRSGGQFAKNPMRIAKAFGFFNLFLFRFALVSLDAGMRRLSHRFRVRVAAVLLSDGAHAIDVDNARTYRIAAMLMERRAA